MMNPDLWTLRSRGSDSCRAVACEKAEAPAAASSTRILQHICAATMRAPLRGAEPARVDGVRPGTCPVVEEPLRYACTTRTKDRGEGNAQLRSVGGRVAWPSTFLVV